MQATERLTTTMAAVEIALISSHYITAFFSVVCYSDTVGCTYPFLQTPPPTYPYPIWHLLSVPDCVLSSKLNKYKWPFV